MAAKKSKTSRETPGINEALKALMEQLDSEPAATGARKPGRPVKHRADTAPVILHLYKSQIRWLDDYAAEVASWNPENARLSRVEIVRGLLLGLAEYAADVDLSLQGEAPIQSERDLQHAMAQALKAKNAK
jgi:hypothetical protein